MLPGAGLLWPASLCRVQRGVASALRPVSLASRSLPAFSAGGPGLAVTHHSTGNEATLRVKGQQKEGAESPREQPFSQGMSKPRLSHGLQNTVLACLGHSFGQLKQLTLCSN